MFQVLLILGMSDAYSNRQAVGLPKGLPSMQFRATVNAFDQENRLLTCFTLNFLLSS